MKKLINTFQKAIDTLEKQMKAIIEAQKDLKETYQKITRIDGIGLITALNFIVVTKNFTSFTQAKKFSCYAGLAPFSYESGSSIRAPKRTSKLRNRNLKSLMIRAAITSAIHDPQMKAYKKRKLEEGKNKMVVNNAIASKLVARIFAVAQREEPFVKFNF